MEMTAVEYLREKARMTKNKNGNCGIHCEDCPLSSRNNGVEELCNILKEKHPEKAVAIVQKWAKEHPRKTMLADLLEKYPNVPMDATGTPDSICPCSLGYEGQRNCEEMKCNECWNRTMEAE